MSKDKSLSKRHQEEKALTDPLMKRFDQEITSAFKKGGEPAVVEWGINTVLTSNQEVMLIIDEVLEGFFGFKSHQIDEFHEYFGRMIVHNVGLLHANGRRALSLEVVRALGEIVRSNSTPEKIHVLEKKLNIVLPQEVDIKNITSGKQ